MPPAPRFTMTEREVFLAVLDLPDPAARAGYLGQACAGDAALRGRVEALLRSHEAIGTFLAVPAVTPPDPAHTRSVADRLTATGGGSTTLAADPPSAGDRYVLGEEIARGGMGVVYRAADTVLGREVAVKVLGNRYGASSAAARRFADEARIAAQLQHPGIPPVHDLGTLPDGRPFLAMKLIRGRTLDYLLANRPDPAHDRGRFVAVFEQVCHALAYAHSHHVIHRDLKPSNVMVGAFGEVQVMDWGLAKVLSGAAPAGGDAAATAAEAEMEVRSLRDSDGTFTQAGSVLGTPAFMPPEQALGVVGKIDRRSDVFGLGAVLAVILTGEPPFAGGSAESLRLRAAQGLVGDCFARLDACGADPELVALCRRCLAPRPESRPADADEVARAVAALRVAAEERARQAELDRVKAVGERAAAEVKAAEQRKRWRVQVALGVTALGLVAAAVLGVALNSLWQRAEWAKEVAVSERGKAEEAQGTAERARDLAIQAEGVAERAREAEAAAKKDAEREREKLAVFEYGRAVEVAHQEWRGNSVSTTLAILAGSRKDLRGWEWGYLHRLCQSDLLTLRGHAGVVSSASFSPDGARVVTAGMDRIARVWDANSGAGLVVFKGHTDGVRSASFSPDGSRVATAGSDWTARLWDAKTGVELLVLKGHAEGVTSASFSPDGARVVTASRDGTARVWDAKNGFAVLAVKGHADAVSSAAFSPDGSRIVTTSADQTARVWDATDGSARLVLKGHTGVASACFSPDGSRVVTGGYDRTARVWDVSTGAELLVIRCHSGVASACFSPDGGRIVTASVDTTARVWDATRGDEVLAFRGHTDGVRFAAFSPDGTRVVTASADSSARVWDARYGPEFLAIRAHADGVRSARFDAGGTRVVTTGKDGTVRAWDARTGAGVPNPGDHPDAVQPGAVGPDRARVITTNEDGTARVRDALTGAELLTLRGHAAGVLSAAFDSDGSRIVTASKDRTARVWDAKTGSGLAVLKGHVDEVTSAAFSPDGTRIVTGSEDTTARVWDAKTGAELLAFKGHADAVSSAAFSPDGTRIVTGSWDKTARVWDSRAFRDTRPPDAATTPTPRRR
ncbi:WD40 repeat domain-containing serine/threonine-protein kinase [Urbifossiella limnaea]|uniref:Serine/threonine-protein kinase PknB n=1 Tax=Urbifossiella limnaea TaxID=2528023 RepID=A0A517XWH7_9BACT|nr:serine/threonine-protein kinase [Urbifossiella limnaea]QDU21860.1 Serine/threonine-protein kinase PknB [Urbifossiella limnaea]